MNCSLSLCSAIHHQPKDVHQWIKNVELFYQSWRRRVWIWKTLPSNIMPKLQFSFRDVQLRHFFWHSSQTYLTQLILIVSCCLLTWTWGSSLFKLKPFKLRPCQTLLAQRLTWSRVKYYNLFRKHWITSGIDAHFESDKDAVFLLGTRQALTEPKVHMQLNIDESMTKLQFHDWNQQPVICNQVCYWTEIYQ